MSKEKNSSILTKIIDLAVYKPEENYSFVLAENEFDKSSKLPVQDESSSNSKEASPTKKSFIKQIFNSNNDKSEESNIPKQKISSDLQKNLEIIKSEISYPQNSDIKIREFTLANEEKTKAFCVYIEPITNSVLLQDIFESLMVPRNFDRSKISETCSLIPNEILRNGEVTQKIDINEAISSLISGQSIFFFDKCAYSIAIETKSFIQRGVEKPTNESSIIGPKEAFVESIRTNLSILRRILKNKNFMVEKIPIGEINSNTCFILYLKDIANPSLVEEVKRRVSSIKIDFIFSVNTLEECIEDNPFSLFPATLITERPDRVCANISEGRVAMIIDNSPSALIVPATITSHLQTTDDTVTRFIYATFIRLFRLIGILISLILPGIYIALVNYHHDMLPTDLLISLERARESVPFPTIIEVLLLDVLFEVIREASVRVPGLVGTTIGIVGALILGQAAVEAKIVSPILVVIIAATGIGSFTVPNYELGIGMRIIRFIFTFSSYLFGFYGISLVAFVTVGLLCSEKSFGVPIFAPFAPLTSNPINDSYIRYPIWMQNTRPDFLQPKTKYKMKENLRKWDKKTPDNRKE